MADSSPNPGHVAIGQVWSSNDPRDKGRRVTVVAIEGDRARVRGLATTRILLVRFKPGRNGYTLVG